MDEASLKRVYELFDAAVDLPRERRDRFLDDACADDAELRLRVMELIESDERTGPEVSGFLDGSPAEYFSPAAEITSLHAVDSLVPGAGAVVAGQYRIVRLIGQGGMGQVFEAQQLDPPRRVALKVIAAARLTPQSIARFRRETMALARLHDPGIATIFGSGVMRSAQGDGDGTALERPFYVMELVEGMPLIEYADRNELSMRDRLALIADIADAVQHAHDQGVVHRDLKPANILVQKDGRAKILDFGIARVLPAARGGEVDLQTITFHTDAGQLLGTLPYMSPEQVSGDSTRVGAPADVYALGVMLYELLTGRLPFDVRGKSVPEAARIICDHDPTPLTSMDHQFRAMRGEVQTIVLKAIEKDVDRRYQSAAELAADLRRHLRDEPIAARPPSAIYRMRKFARRNKALVGGVAGIFIALCAGLAATSVFAIRAGRSAELARLSEQVALDQQSSAQRQAYRAGLAAAVAALENHDVAAARVHLEAAPEHLRGWEWRHLWSRLDESVVSFTAPEHSLYAWFHPKNGTILTAGGADDLFVHEWKPAGGSAQLLREWTFHESRPQGGFHVGGDGDVIAFLANGGASVEVLNLLTGQHVKRPISDPPRAWPHWRVAIDNTGAYIVITFEMFDKGGGTPVWGFDLTSQTLWQRPSTRGTWSGQLAIGRQRSEFRDQRSEVRGQKSEVGDENLTSDLRSLSFASEPMPLIGIATAEHHVAEIHDPSSDTMIELVGHDGGVTSIQFSPDGSRVATAARDNTVRLWDARTGRPLAVGRGHRSAVATVRFSPCGTRLASGADDHTVRIWEVDGSAVDLKPVAVLHGHEAPLRSVAFSADGRSLVSFSRDLVARTWDAVSREAGLVEPHVLRGHTSYVYPVAVSPDGRIIASGSWDRTIRLWEREARGRTSADRGQKSEVSGQTSDGGHAAPTSDLRPLTSVLHGHRSYVEKLAFSGDGRLLVSYGAGSERTLRVWSVETLSEVASVHRPHCHQLAFHPDHRRVFLEWVHDSSEQRIVAARYWNPFTGAIEDEPLPAAAHPGPTGAGFVTSDGELAVEIAGAEGRLTARIFENRAGGAGRIISEFPVGGYSETAGSVLWLDEKHLITIDAPTGSAIVIRDARTGEETAVLRGHTGNIFGAAISPDRSRLVTVGRDQLVHVWDVQAAPGAEALAQLRGHTSYIWSAAFTPDGGTLVTASGDYTLRIWESAPQ